MNVEEWRFDVAAMAKQIFLKKFLDFLPWNPHSFKESDDNKIQESCTKIQEHAFMQHYRITDISSWDNLPASRSVIRGDYDSRIGARADSKVEKKKCPRCSRWCKYYATKSTSIIMCPSCGKKFDPKSNLSSSGRNLAVRSSLYRKKQDHQRLFLEVR